MPPARGIMEAVSEPNTYRTVVMKATQTSFTECLLNTAGWLIDQEPCPILIILPTIEICGLWSKERLAPMIRDTPALRNKVQDARTRDSDNTIRGKAFAGGRLSITGANSAAGLASRPIRVILGDEIDKWPQSAGTEGSPLKLAEKRTDTFWNRKIIIGSSPGLKSLSVVYKEFMESDQRRYYVPCPDCNHPQTLKFERVLWPKSQEQYGQFGKHRTDEAAYCCEHCGSFWDDSTRWKAISEADVRASEGDKTVGWIADRSFDGIAGFHLPGLLSSWRTHREIAEEFLSSRYDPYRYQVFVNSVLGEPFEGDEIDRADVALLQNRGEAYGIDNLPSGVLCVTAGCDVQKNRIEVTFIGWGVADECWVISHDVLHGDPALADIWADLDELLLSRFTTEDGRRLSVRAACIDSAYESAAVFKFCRVRQLARRIYAVRGIASTISKRPIWTSTPSKAGYKGAERVFIVGSDTAKEAIYSATTIKEPGPGYIHFPSDRLPKDYFEQLTSEELVTSRKQGGALRREWILPPGKRNECLDTFCYALAARKSLHVDFRRASENRKTMADFARLGS